MKSKKSLCCVYSPFINIDLLTFSFEIKHKLNRNSAILFCFTIMNKIKFLLILLDSHSFIEKDFDCLCNHKGITNVKIPNSIAFKPKMPESLNDFQQNTNIFNSLDGCILFKCIQIDPCIINNPCSSNSNKRLQAQPAHFQEHLVLGGVGFYCL